MSDYTRVTVVGGERKAELVLPNDVALASLLPRLLDLLGEPTGSAARPVALVRVTGEQLDLSLGAADQSLPDGELLRVVRRDEAPPPPEIVDVTDVLAERRATHPGRWTDRARVATGAAGVGLLALGAGFAALGIAELPAALVLPIAVAVLWLLAVLAGRAQLRWTATAATAAAVGLAPATAAAIAAWSGLAEAASVLPATGALALTIAWSGVALCVGVGRRSRAAGWGGLLGAVLAALPLALAPLGWSTAQSAAVAGIVATIACGVLPWFALSASGLTGLDDQVVEGRPRRREEAATTVDAAFAALGWGTAAVAVPIAAAIALLPATGDPWALGLAAAIALVAALRTRAFPLTVQVAVLWAAVAVGVGIGLVTAPFLPVARTLLLVVVALVAVLLAGMRPPAHRRAALRRFGNALETISVVAMAPLLLGLFGVYADLLEAF